MRATLTRAALVVTAALIFMASCFAWDNRDPQDAYWHNPSPVAWFVVAVVAGLVFYATRNRSSGEP